MLYLNQHIFSIGTTLGILSIGVLDTINELRKMLSRDTISHFFLAKPKKKSVKLGVQYRCVGKLRSILSIDTI